MLIKFNGSIAWECESTIRTGISGVSRMSESSTLHLIVMSWQAAHPLAHGQVCSSALLHSETGCWILWAYGSLKRIFTDFSQCISLSPSQSIFFLSVFLCFSGLNLLHSFSEGWRSWQSFKTRTNECRCVSHTHSHTRTRVWVCVAPAFINHTRTHTNNKHTWWSGTETPTSRLGSFVRYIIIDSRISTAFESSQTNTKFLFSGAQY